MWKGPLSTCGGITLGGKRGERVAWGNDRPKASRGRLESQTELVKGSWVIMLRKHDKPRGRGGTKRYKKAKRLCQSDNYGGLYEPYSEINF